MCKNGFSDWKKVELIPILPYVGIKFTFGGLVWGPMGAALGPPNSNFLIFGLRDL